MFDINIGKVILDVMKDADSLKKNKKDVASITRTKDKQLYFLLTEEQFDLMIKKKATPVINKTRVKK